jgi:hypothetical protein
MRTFVNSIVMLLTGIVAVTASLIFAWVRSG